MAVSSQCISFYPFVPWDRLEQKRALLVSALSLRILLNVSFQNPLHPPGGRSRPHEGSTPGFRHFPTMVPDSYLFRAVDPFPPLSTPLLFPMNPTRTRGKKICILKFSLLLSRFWNANVQSQDFVDLTVRLLKSWCWSWAMLPLCPPLNLCLFLDQLLKCPWIMFCHWGHW